jgi:hypothetical protein
MPTTLVEVAQITVDEFQITEVAEVPSVVCILIAHS